MGGDDEVVNVMFMVREKGVNVGLVDDLCALSLGKDEVAKEKETEGGVEG